MARKELTMRKIKEILRLKNELGLSDRQVGRSLNISHSTVREYQKRAERTGISWPQAEEMGEDKLRSKLFPKKGQSGSKRPQPDWQWVEKELHRPGVTRMLLWQEYIDEYPEGYGYSQFCQLYRQWSKTQEKPVMRVPKKAGEEVQVDYAGQTVQVIDPQTGELKEAQVFVGVLGASGLIYAEAHWSQSLPNWIQAHVRMFDFFGGAPKIIRPDNLKSGVTHPSYYDPDINPTYHEMAEHYGAVVIPTRVKKPKDKALVENAVQQAERWILAVLRDRRFFSLYELNQAIRKQLKWLNHRKRSDHGLSRREMFTEIEKQSLQVLPVQPFVYREVKQAKVHIDYHVTFKKHHYSVPHAYARQKVLIRASEHLVEVYTPNNRRIACHQRVDKFGYSTEKEHMPANHRWYLEWSPDRFCRWAEQIGPHTTAMITAVLESRKHPEQAYRTCLGILGLAKKDSTPADLEAACQLALEAGAHSYRAVKKFMQNQKISPSDQHNSPTRHEHVRGGSYYS
jgi:transposase